MNLRHDRDCVGYRERLCDGLALVEKILLYVNVNWAKVPGASSRAIVHLMCNIIRWGYVNEIHLVLATHGSLAVQHRFQLRRNYQNLGNAFGLGKRNNHHQHDPHLPHTSSKLL